MAFVLGQAGDPFGGGGERDALPGQAGADRDGDGEMRFAGAGRAEQDDVLACVQEVELAEMLDHLLLHRALEGEVELLQRLSAGKRAALIRPSPPCDSRAATSVESSASQKRS